LRPDAQGLYDVLDGPDGTDSRLRPNQRFAVSLTHSPLADQLLDAGLGTLSEIFDGEPPHRPRGCPVQAWSVGCVLDAWTGLERVRWGRQG